MKKKFRFRLEAVEKVRRSKEQEALRALAEAQSRYQEALLAKQILIEETQAALVRREGLASEARPILEYRLENEFIEGNKRRMLQADHAILRAKRFVEKALRQVLMAKREVKAIETLREKAYAEFRGEMAKKERKELEELYATQGRSPLLEEEWSEIA